MNILTLDPGTTHTAWMLYDTARQLPVKFDWVENSDILVILENNGGDLSFNHVVCEGIQSYGMPVGRETFETCIWIGRFMQLADNRVPFQIMYRRDVKLNLCNSVRAKDSNVRQALLDRFPATGGGKTPQVGTKAARGPLYGVSKHVWSTLAIAVTWCDCARLD